MVLSMRATGTLAPDRPAEGGSSESSEDDRNGDRRGKKKTGKKGGGRRGTRRGRLRGSRWSTWLRHGRRDDRRASWHAEGFLGREEFEDEEESEDKTAVEAERRPSPSPCRRSSPKL